MPYGTVKVDNITYTQGGSDATVSVSGLANAISGNITVTGTISGNIIQGGSTVSGQTVTGTTANFVSGVFTTQVSGATITGNTGKFANITGVSGVFTTYLSGSTITGNSIQYTTSSGVTTTIVSGIFTSLSGASVTGDVGNFTSVTGGNFVGVSGVFTTQVSGATVTGDTGKFTTLTGVSGVFTTQVSGATVTGNAGAFTTLTGQTATLSTGNVNYVNITAPSNVNALAISGWGAARWAGAELQWGGLDASQWTTISFYTNGTSRYSVNSSGRITVSNSCLGTVSALGSVSGTVTLDLITANNFSLTLPAGGAVTLANPSNQTAGQSGSIVITQNGTTAATVAYGSNWKFSGGTPTMSTGLGSVSVLVYYVESSSRITARLITDVQ